MAIADQRFRSFRFKSKHSTSASFNRYPSAELVRMDQFFKHRSPGRFCWQEYCLLVKG